MDAAPSRPSEKFLKLDALILFSFACGISGVILDFIIGNNLSVNLATASDISWWTYFVRRYSIVSGPRFVKARRYLKLGLVINITGAILVSISSVENYFIPGSGSILRIVGVIVAIGGLPGMLFVIRHPKP